MRREIHKGSRQGGVVAIGAIIAFLLGAIVGAAVYQGEKYPGQAAHSYQEPVQSDK